MAKWNSTALASTIEHTLLKSDTTLEQVEKRCEEAVAYGFHGVCIPPYFVSQAKIFLKKNSPKLITVAGFPLGYQPKEVKLLEAIRAIQDGADEIDMVINVAAFKSGQIDHVSLEINALASLCRAYNKISKVILETAYLSQEEILQLCKLCAEAKVDFAKTSTGFAPAGADPAIIKLMRDKLPPHIKIKASGGIRDREQALAMLNAGADRIGTSSGIKIISE